MSTTQPQLIVIGAGLGGLAAAIRLLSRGYAVTVLEATDRIGGRASVFERDGFVFDAGPTVVTAPYLFDELFAVAGRRFADHVQMRPVDPFYRVDFDDGSRFDYVGDEDRIVRQIADFSPRDVAGYHKLVAHSKEIFAIGYEQLAHVPFDRLTDMLRVVPAMLRLRNHKSVYALVSEYIRDERLRQVFTFQPLLVGGNPFRTSSIYLLIHWLERKWGVHWPLGGTGSIVRAMAQLVADLGGEVVCNANVAEIEVHHGQVAAVRTADGQRRVCTAVVANADPSRVYRQLVAPQHRHKWTDRKIGRVVQSMSLFVAYFGTSKRYPAVKHHTIVLGPRYRELLSDIFVRHRLADDFSLYLHRPTASDPSMAPPGCEAFYVLAPIPNDISNVDWQARHASFKDAIYRRLEQTVLPGLRDHIVTDFAFDSRYFAGRLQSEQGAAFGPEPLLRQSAWFRYHNRSEDVGGLFFVGAGTHPGAGMPGVLTSAKVLDAWLPAVAQVRAP